ncbi:MAG: TonB-dependent receptor [Melioribacteraceae bacterium]|nr:TonB-dependent receptor [Melioribacteraceae bacterium]
MKKITLLLFFAASFIAAQNITLVGDVSSMTHEQLVGVNIIVKGTTTGVATDIDGKFKLEVDKLPITLVFSSIGYKKKTVLVDNVKYIKIVLEGDVYSSEDVMVVGSRFRPRTAITSPVPIDNIKVADLEATAQTSFDKMMHYTVPSFNSTQQTISDATAHFDPADLRGLGPSRTLVLINGKRKNASSLVFINDTPGKGDVGVDMNSIPVSAIKRVEVLRDGASAQYGSDAIAGVINIILDDQTETTRINTFSSITSEGDGFQLGANINTGFKIGDLGFFNLSSGYVNQEETNRAGSPGKDVLFGVPASDPWIKANPDLGMTVGLPNMTTANIYYNTAIEVGELSEIYSYGGLVYRQGLSYALYRAPYWVPDPYNLLHKEGTAYEGFQPTFETDIFDNEFTAGFRSQKNGWKYDLSYTFGSNKVDYLIGNTLNPALGAASPTEFNAGGYRFNNNIINFDISKLLFDRLFLSLGSEFRIENFIAVEGEEASYIGGGAQSFPGLQPQNAVDAKRTNIGVYVDLGYDITNNLFVGGAARYEEYSDFGSNVTYKINARIKTSDNKYSLRGSMSTGFRAPSLHQIYLSNIQTLVSGGTVSNQGTFNNNSPVLRKLGVEQLKEENAVNITFGAAARPIDNLFVSVDVYQISVDDRIVYSSSIASSDTTTTVWKILKENDITSLKFFINAANTKTQGIDLVANYGYNRWAFNFAATIAKHEIDGKIKTPDVLEKDGVDIFDRKEQSRLLTARPNTKIIFGTSYDLNPFKVGLSATYFGEVTWQHANNGLNGVDVGNGPLPIDDAAYDQTFAAKIIFDLNLRYAINENISFSFMINNLLDTYPDVIDTKGDFVTDLGGRFKYPWEVNQFGFNGRVFLATLNFTL